MRFAGQTLVEDYVLTINPTTFAVPMKMAWTARLAAGALTCLLMSLATAHADDAAAAADQAPGVWQKHTYSFAFLGFTSTYSCDGLASKLKLLLIAAGARADAKASPGACASTFGRPDKFARAELTFYSLAPASAAKPGEGPAVAGSWLPVAIADQHPYELGLGDCELVDQFRTSVLPLFTTRQIENHTTCIPHQESGSNIDLRFQSFGVPKPIKQAAS